MTLADERAAIRAGITASRQASARPTQPARPVDNGAARRASGAANVAARRGDQVAEDINRLRNPEPRRAQPLRPIAPVGPVPAAQGRGVYRPPAAAQGGGGIASPLTEEDYADREYWDSVDVTSSDGLLTFRIRPIRSITQTDSAGAEVVQNFAEPVDP